MSSTVNVLCLSSIFSSFNGVDLQLLSLPRHLSSSLEFYWSRYHSFFLSIHFSPCSTCPLPVFRFFFLVFFSSCLSLVCFLLRTRYNELLDNVINVVKRCLQSIQLLIYRVKLRDLTNKHSLCIGAIKWHYLFGGFQFQ